MRASRRPRRAALLTAILPVVVALTGCSVPGSGPEPDEAVDRLAAALSAGDLAGVHFVGGDPAARRAYAAATAGLAPGVEPRVRPGTVTADGDSARATLRWSWPLAGKTWSYTTRVALARQGSGDAEAWRVRWAPTILEPSLAGDERLATSSVKPLRGDILGAGEKPIVTLRPVLRVGVDKSQIPGAAGSTPAAELARLVRIDPRAYTRQVDAAGRRAFVQAIVYRRDEAPDALLGRLGAIPGVRAISDRMPLAPTKDFAPGLLGSVGPATAELVKDAKGRIRAGDDVGISGLQRRYDESLFGTSGVVVVAVDDRGQRRRLFSAAPQPGQPLRTTLDPGVQEAAQAALAGVAPASALVAIQPSTGKVLAAASGPGSKGYNTATYGRYAPGSTFKVVSALALLRAGLKPTTPVTCPATTVVDGKTFKNYDDYPASGLGRIPLQDALANSCNTAFIGQRAQVGKDGLAQAAAALGLGVDHDLGFPAYFGQVEPPGSETQAAAGMIGQGSVLASPMAMATVVASVLHGAAVLPTLLPGVEVTRQDPATPLTGGEAGALRAMLRRVVERGSGSVLRSVPGGPVIAKTGTAEFGDTPPLPTHAWMIAGRGDLAVAVFVERGESGSRTAGPVLRRFLEDRRVP